MQGNSWKAKNRSRGFNKIVKDRDTGRSKGFGFVEMTNDEDANKAIAALNETDLDGRTIVVKPANPKPPTGDQPQQIGLLLGFLFFNQVSKP